MVIIIDTVFLLKFLLIYSFWLFFLRKPVLISPLLCGLPDFPLVDGMTHTNTGTYMGVFLRLFFYLFFLLI